MYELWLIGALIVMFCVVTYFCIKTFSKDKYRVIEPPQSQSDTTESFESLASPYDSVVTTFKSSRGRLPTKLEADDLVAKIQSGNLNLCNLESYIGSNYGDNTTPAAKIENMFNTFESSVNNAIANQSNTNRKAVAEQYSALFCLALQGQTLKEFYILMEQKYKEKMIFILDCVKDFPDQSAVCNPDEINAIDIKMFDDPTTFCAAIDDNFCGNGREQNARLMVSGDSQRFNLLISASEKACQDKILRCEVKPVQTANADSVQMGDDKTVNFIVNRPNIYYRNKQSDDSILQNGNERGFENEITKKCMMDFQKKSSLLADYNSQRDADELKFACDLSTAAQQNKKYLNADDSGRLLPGQEWSVPQLRPPVCTVTAKATVNDSLDQTALLGTLLSDAKDTGIGSLMPKFQYIEQTSKDQKFS